MMSNYFIDLNNINVNEHTEEKGSLTYLSWAWAWGEVKKIHPDANYTIYENKDGWNYFTDGKTCWVKTGVTVKGIEHIEYLPVMNSYNKSIPFDAVTSFDVNKTIQRSLTKACARHGLGLYIYAGEDLPESESKPKKTEKPEFEKEAIAEKTARTKAYNKGEQPKEPQKTLEQRKNDCIAYAKNLTKEEYIEKSNSIKDKFNGLMRELKEKGCVGWLNEVELEYNRLTALDDKIPY